LSLGYWRQRAEKRLGYPPQTNQKPLVVETRMEDSRWAWSEQVHGMSFFIHSMLWRCWLGDSKDIWYVKSLALACWLWRFDWSFVHLVAPVVTTTSIILALLKFRMVALWYRLTRIVLEYECCWWCLI